MNNINNNVAPLLVNQINDNATCFAPYMAYHIDLDSLRVANLCRREIMDYYGAKCRSQIDTVLDGEETGRIVSVLNRPVDLCRSTIERLPTKVDANVFRQIAHPDRHKDIVEVRAVREWIRQYMTGQIRHHNNGVPFRIDGTVGGWIGSLSGDLTEQRMLTIVAHSDEHGFVQRKLNRNAGEIQNEINHVLRCQRSAIEEFLDLDEYEIEDVRWNGFANVVGKPTVFVRIKFDTAYKNAGRLIGMVADEANNRVDHLTRIKTVYVWGARRDERVTVG